METEGVQRRHVLEAHLLGDGGEARTPDLDRLHVGVLSEDTRVQGERVHAAAVQVKMLQPLQEQEVSAVKSPELVPPDAQLLKMLHVPERSVRRRAQPVVAQVQGLQRSNAVKRGVRDGVESTPGHPELHQPGTDALEVPVLEDADLVLREVEHGEVAQPLQRHPRHRPQQVVRQRQLPQ